MVGEYLSQLEKEKSISETLETPPPEYSSFYWNNNHHKYKAYIPTKNCNRYINLEEYDAYDIIHSDLEVKDHWRLAKRNICLAFKEKEDKRVNRKMNRLIRHLLNKRRQLQLDNITNDRFSIPWGSSKFYVLLDYDVENIKNVKNEDRYKHAKTCERIWLSDEDQEIIDLINNTFEVIAERFANDPKRKVFHYTRALY